MAAAVAATAIRSRLALRPWRGAHVHARKLTPNRLLRAGRMDRDAAPIFHLLWAMTPRRRAQAGGIPPATGSPSDAARRRRLASRRLLKDSRILVWEHAQTQPMLARLASLGCFVVSSSSIEQAIALHRVQPFALILASPGTEREPHFAVLKLLRRALPAVALVLLATEASVAVRLHCQTLRPQYFATQPLEEAELRAILRLVGSRRPAPPRA